MTVPLIISCNQGIMEREFRICKKTPKQKECIGCQKKFTIIDKKKKLDVKVDGKIYVTELCVACFEDNS